MKYQLALLTLIIVSLFLIISNTLAEPTWTAIIDQSSVRPGTSGTITISIQNTDPVNEKTFKFCVEPTGSATAFVTGTCDESITYLNTGQSATAKLSYSISNEAPTPSSQSVSITISYLYTQFNTWFPANYAKPKSISVAGISIKDETSQKITQVETSISTALNAITSARTSITTAQNMITTAQQQNKDVSIANIDLSNAQSSLRSAQTSIESAQTKHSQAQSSFTATSYQDSLNFINQASSDANVAASYASSANQAASQAQTDATNAVCITNYTLQLGKCVQIQNPNDSNTQNNDWLSKYWWIFVIALIIIVGIWYSSSGSKHHEQKPESV